MTAAAAASNDQYDEQHGAMAAHTAEILSEINRKLERVLTKLEEIERITIRHDKMLFGNGSIGLNMRVDRIEQRGEMRQTHIEALWASFSALLVGLLIKWWYK